MRLFNPSAAVGKCSTCDGACANDGEIGPVTALIASVSLPFSTAAQSSDFLSAEETYYFFNIIKCEEEELFT
jgi:hypothetical protein